MHNFRRNTFMIIASAIGAAFLVMIMLPFAGRASQNALGLPTTGVFSGLAEQNSINNALDALLTCNSGSSAPTNALGGSPKEGQCWLDTTSSTMKIKKRYSGAAWVVEGFIDVTNGIWIPAAGGGAGTVASASTTDLCLSPQEIQTVTGTATITSFGSSCVVGTKRTLQFGGAALITYGASTIILPAAVNYTTTAGDVVELWYGGSGTWKVSTISRVNGQAVINPSVDLGTILMSSAASAPAKYVFGFGQALTRTSFPDYLAAVTRTQNGTATSGSPTLATVSDTSAMGAGMPIEGTCLPTNTTIASVTGSSITASANATTNGTCSVTVFFTGYGSGGSSSTVGVVDCRGRNLAGRDDMGGTAASRLTSGATGFGANGAQLNVAGGSQSHTLSTTEMPSHNHAVFLNDPGHAHTYAQPSSPVSAVTGGAGLSVSITTANTGSSTTGITVRDTTGGGGTANQTATAGSGGAHSVQNPTLIANCVVRVLALAFPPANDNDRPIVRGREPIAIARDFA